MSIGQGIFVSFLKHLWSFGKEVHEKRRVSHMTPQELKEWRKLEFSRINKEAVKLADYSSDNDLRKKGIKRTDLVRTYEVILISKLGVPMSDILFEKLDIRGLDLRRLRSLKQQQVDQVIGDSTTKLPKKLEMPQSWKGKG